MLTFSFYIIFKLNFYEKRGQKIIQDAPYIGARTVFTFELRDHFAISAGLSLIFVLICNIAVATHTPRQLISLRSCTVGACMVLFTGWTKVNPRFELLGII